MKPYYLVKDFEQEVGWYTVSAIRQKIQKGIWLNGREYTKSPDGHIFIIISEVMKYIESTKPIIPKDLMY